MILPIKMQCVHVPEYKSKHGLDSYKTIFDVLLSNNKKKKVWVSCFSCDEELGRMLACLHCVYVGCIQTHVNLHYLQTGHKLFVELANGNIFCHICKDYCYDKDIIVLQRQLNVDNVIELQMFKWKPSPAEELILTKHKNMIKVLPSTKVRGLVNLGQTCFMNCIMQALIHTPMLRDYFFADKHVSHTAKLTDCLVCLFSRLFQKYYSRDKTCLCLQDILYVIYQGYKHFEPSNQEDAHEFFMVALNALHQNLVAKNVSSEECSCIIDVIFQCTMQSDLQCQSCFNISTKVEYIKGLPLEIPKPPAAANLYECLNYFTRAEPLSSQITCRICKNYRQGTLQLTLKTLPLVIVMQLKRIENNGDSGHIKTNTFVSFPMDLDMSPYMLGLRKKNGKPQTIPRSSETASDYQYSLYAVIEHLGTVGGGHYVAYIKKQTDVWYRCSDTIVEKVSTDDVLGCEGYLLFYHKTVLNYS